MPRQAISYVLFVGVLVIAALPLVLASPDSGVAVLYVYRAGYSSPWPIDDQGRYSVVPGDIIYIHLHNLNDPGAEGWTSVEVRVGTPGPAISLGSWTRQEPDPLHGGAGPYVGDSGHVISWVVADYPPSTTFVIQYRYNNLNRNFVAGGAATVGHLHVVPETALGVAGSLIAGIAALAVFTARRRR